MPRAAVVLALLVLAPSCASASFEISFGGRTGSVDEAATFLIEGELADQLGEPLTADCPEVPDPEVGSTFVCTGTTTDGREIEFAGVIDREDHIDVNTTNLITAETVPELAAIAERSVEATVGFDVTVHCGETFIVLDEGAATVCDVTDPGGVTAELHLTDIDLVDETFDWEIVEPA